jgi:hypothetical protein
LGAVATGSSACRLTVPWALGLVGAGTAATTAAGAVFSIRILRVLNIGCAWSSANSPGTISTMRETLPKNSRCSSPASSTHSSTPRQAPIRTGHLATWA